MLTSILTVLFGILSSTANAGEHSISGGFGHYYGGFGAAYTYSPVVGLGIQAGYGTLGAGMGVRWEPTWLSGGYAQSGLARVGGGYHPNMVVGAKWHPEDTPDWFLDANAGVAVSLGGSRRLKRKVGVGKEF